MISCVFGKRGSGKTTVARDLSHDSLRVIVSDPLMEYRTDYSEHFETIQNLACKLQTTRNDPKFYYTFYPVDVLDSDKLLLIADSIQNCTVVLEEIDLICSPTYIPPHLSDSIRRGRHFNVDLIAVSRRPAEVPRLLTSQAQRFYLFHFSEPRDLDYFAQTFDDETAEKIGRLGEHEYMVKDL